MGKWKKPWNVEKFDNLYNKDERFFSLVVKGAIAWLNKNFVLYNKPIRHFIFSTGSSYMYIESNGYEYSFNETSGEDWLYMETPRCVIEMSDISFDTDSLSNRFARGEYERFDEETNTIRGYNAEIARIPITMHLSLKYVLSTFNEALVLIQEIIDKMIYQKFFKIVYLGQMIECGIEFPTTINPELNKIDLSSTETNQKVIQLDLNITSNYPVINERSEVPNDKIISEYAVTNNII